MVNVMLVGCLHGELDKMYKDIQETEKQENNKIDIVLCCGDFQSVRNHADLCQMSVPPKFRKMGDFWRYYSGEKVAPYLTVFIGGNHEAIGFLQELPYGGWVAEKIYYLGYCGVVNFAGLRIGGLSGIYKRHDYFQGHFEHPPYDDMTKRTAYHIRNIDVLRLSQISRSRLDIVLSHDWPCGIDKYGNSQKLISQKPHFREEIQQKTLGNPASSELLCKLRPRYWISAHLHVKFAARVKFASDGKITDFLALDKALPFRDYIQLLKIEPQNPVESPYQLELDPEWLCILQKTNSFMSINRSTNILQEDLNNLVTDEEIKEIEDLFQSKYRIPNNFKLTAPVHNSQSNSSVEDKAMIYINPQTDLMCAMLDLIHPNSEFSGSPMNFNDLAKKLMNSQDGEGDYASDKDSESSCTYKNEADSTNPDEIELGDIPDSSDDSSSDVNTDNKSPKPEEYNPMDYSIVHNQEQPAYCPDEPDI